MHIYNAGLIVRIHVPQALTKNMTEGIAVCFALDDDHQAAIRSMVMGLKQRGLQFLDLHGEISEIDPAKWDDFIRRTWPESVSQLPTQAELVASTKKSAYFGPVLAYRRDG